MKYLLHHHANPNLKDHREEAPLHAAVRTGNVEMVEVKAHLVKINIVVWKKTREVRFSTYAESGKA